MPEAVEPSELLCRAVLFDCDGVLVDSRRAAESAWRQWSREFGLADSFLLTGVHGRRSQDTVNSYLPPSRQRSGLQRIEELELAAATLTRPLPGAPELLRAAASFGAIVTSASRPLVQARLRGAGIPVPTIIVTAADVTRGKPFPDGYLLAARLLGVPISACIVIEDSAAGIAAGRASGATVVGVGADAAAGAPDLVVADLRGLRWTGHSLGVGATQQNPDPSPLSAH